MFEVSRSLCGEVVARADDVSAVGIFDGKRGETFEQSEHFGSVAPTAKYDKEVGGILGRWTGSRGCRGGVRAITKDSGDAVEDEVGEDKDGGCNGDEENVEG